MAHHTLQVLLFIMACAYTVLGQKIAISESNAVKFIQHIQTAVDECTGNDELVNDTRACFEELTAEAMEGSILEGVLEFIDCLEPYKRMLEGCSTASHRDDDLTAFELVKTYQKTNGSLYTEIQDILRTHLCSRSDACANDKTDSEKVAVYIYTSCMEELGAKDFVFDDLQEGDLTAIDMWENLCSSGSGVRTCMARAKSFAAGTPCEEFFVSRADIALMVFRFLEAETQSAVVSHCFAMRTT